MGERIIKTMGKETRDLIGGFEVKTDLPKTRKLFFVLLLKREVVLKTLIKVLNRVI